VAVNPTATSRRPILNGDAAIGSLTGNNTSLTPRTLGDRDLQDFTQPAECSPPTPRAVTVANRRDLFVRPDDQRLHHNCHYLSDGSATIGRDLGRLQLPRRLWRQVLQHQRHRQRTR
jgi:hypothetical protein